MRNWKCPVCHGETETENNVIVAVCPECKKEITLLCDKLRGSKNE